MFESIITVGRDASLDVIETMVVNFQGSERHGLRRFIPVEYERSGVKYKLDLRVINVVDESNRPIPYSVSREDNDVMVQMGDPDVAVTGFAKYFLHYKVRQGLNFFGDHPELYWDVTGDQWAYPLSLVGCEVRPPNKLIARDLTVKSYVGVPGATKEAVTDTSLSTAEFVSKDIQPGQAMAIIIGFPPGSIEKPTELTEIGWFLQDHWPLLALPSVALFLMAFLYWFLGRDESPRMPINVEWNPPKDLTPAEVGTVIDESCDMQDVVSTLVDLAARGYLKIKEIQSEGSLIVFQNKDYIFARTEPPVGALALLPHERTFLNALFEDSEDQETIRASQLMERFYVHLPALKSSIYDSLVQKGMFFQSPDRVRQGYFTVGGFLAVGGTLLASYMEDKSWGLGCLLAGVIIVLLARAMPARTAVGCKALAQILGFQRFVKVVQSERIKTLINEDPKAFGRFLPYAMVLGAADQWAQAFMDVIKEPPEWFEPCGSGGEYKFTTNGFVCDLASGMRAMERAFSTSPIGSQTGGGISRSSQGPAR